MKKKNSCFCFFVLFLGILWGQNQKYSWDFSDCDIKDILFAVSLDTGISIVADDTVSGTGSFRFVGNDFEVGFDSFMNSSRLYVNKNDDFWVVSKCKITESENGFSLDAYDLTPFQILEKLSKVLKNPITYDSLPSNVLNIHFKDLSEEKLLEKELCFLKHVHHLDVE